MRAEEARALQIPFLVSRSTASTLSNKTGIWSFVQPSYKDRTAPCSAACPCATDIPRVEALLAQGRAADAWRTILAENPLPGVCGRVCFHPCEAACNRGDLDHPVSINALERALADAARDHAIPDGLVPAAPQGKRIAIAGSGPAGLSAAYFLTLLGYTCDVFETESKPGGLLRWGIPEYRLPVGVLEEEIARLRALGVVFHCEKPLDQAFLSDAGPYAALVIACGQGRALPLGVPGEELARDGLALLHDTRRPGAAALNASASRKDGGRVAVIGGGNSAVDTARTLLRMGKKPVIVYRRRREDMPAFDHEIKRALEEGVELLELLAPLSLERADGGIRMELQRMRSAEAGPDGRLRSVPLPGKTESLTISEVYSAIGAGASAPWLEPEKNPAGPALSRCALVAGALPAVFAGDLTIKEKSVTDAIASGKEAALALDVLFHEGESEVARRLDECRIGDGSSISMEVYLGGPRAEHAKTVVRFENINVDYFPPAARAEAAALPAGEAILSFKEVESTLDLQAAEREAERCFNCGTCNGCDNCRTFCPDAAVILEGANRRIDTDYCKGCGVCVAECPRFAMAFASGGMER